MTGRHATGQPGAIWTVPREITAAEADEIRRQLARHLDDGRWVARQQRRAVARTLPARIRFRLWVKGRIDAVAIWLVDHGHVDAARALWRAAGMWRTR